MCSFEESCIVDSLLNLDTRLIQLKHIA